MSFHVKDQSIAYQTAGCVTIALIALMGQTKRIVAQDIIAHTISLNVRITNASTITGSVTVWMTVGMEQMKVLQCVGTIPVFLELLDAQMESACHSLRLVMECRIV